MTQKKGKFFDIDDFDNTENIIKEVDPSFNQIVKNLPGPVANFGQHQMSMSLRKKEGEKDDGREKPFHTFLRIKSNKGARNVNR